MHAAADGTRVGVDEVVQLLVAAGANVNARDKVSRHAYVIVHWYVAPWYVPPLHTLLTVVRHGYLPWLATAVRRPDTRTRTVYGSAHMVTCRTATLRCILPLRGGKAPPCDSW